jgi:hypothetical protein
LDEKDCAEVPFEVELFSPIQLTRALRIYAGSNCALLNTTKPISQDVCKLNIKKTSKPDHSFCTTTTPSGFSEKNAHMWVTKQSTPTTLTEQMCVEINRCQTRLNNVTSANTNSLPTTQDKYFALKAQRQTIEPKRS